jgi:hypothetical protein
LSFAAKIKAFSCTPLIFLVCIEIVAYPQPNVISDLGLGKCGCALDKGEALAEIPKTLGSLDPLRSIQQPQPGAYTR